MTEEELLNDLRQNIYCRIAPSTTHGIGVFAIKDIPEGVHPFEGVVDPEIVRIPAARVFDDPSISDEVKSMVRDFYAIEDGAIWFPDHSMNRLDISYFVNHSTTPNLTYLFDQYLFVANRPIKKGEELTADYTEYSEETPRPISGIDYGKQ